MGTKCILTCKVYNNVYKVYNNMYKVYNNVYKCV